MAIALLSAFTYIVFIVGFVYFIITQVVIPINKSEQMFPMFRRIGAKRRELAKNKAELNSLKEIVVLEKELSQLQKRINQQKSK